MIALLVHWLMSSITVEFRPFGHTNRKGGL